MRKPHFTREEDGIVAEEYRQGRGYAARAARRITALRGTPCTPGTVYMRVCRSLPALRGSGCFTHFSQQEDDIIAACRSKGGRWAQEAARLIKERLGMQRKPTQICNRRQYTAGLIKYFSEK